jgi:hypothetical protein
MAEPFPNLSEVLSGGITSLGPSNTRAPVYGAFLNREDGPDADSMDTSTTSGSGLNVGNALGFETPTSTPETSSDWGLGFTGRGPSDSGFNPGFSLSTPMGKVGIDALDIAMSIGLTALTGVPGLGMVANAIGSAFGPPAPSVNAIGQQAMYGYGNQNIDAYGNPVGSMSNIASEMNMGNQGYDAADDVEGMMSDAVQGFADAHGGEVGGGPGSGEPDSGGMGGGQPFQRGGIMDVGAARMDEMMNRFNLEREKDNGYQEIGAYSTDQRRPGVDTRNFYLRTPKQGVPFGSFGGDTPLLNLTGNYGSSTTEVTPETVHPGISQEDIDYFNLKNQEEESTSYNAGLRATFSDGMFPEWMRRVLDLKSANVSYGRSKYERRNTRGEIDESISNRIRGIGGLGQVLPRMFGNAPTVRVQYDEPNKFDRQFSGNVNIPVGKGNLDLSAARYINEGRDNSESYKAGFNYPFEYGTLSADAERTADGENRFGARLRIPLN